MTAEPVKLGATLRVTAPFTREQLQQFLACIPPHAQVQVATHQGGSQRDPETTGYTFSAKWEAKS